MARLLDLPNELLEIVVEYAIVEGAFLVWPQRNGRLICTQPGVRKHDIGTARSLRLVHRRLMDFVEVHMFHHVCISFSLVDFQDQKSILHLLKFPAVRKMTHLRLKGIVSSTNDPPGWAV